MLNNSTGTEVITQKLKHAKLRITPQRMLILGELVGNPDHPTADTVYQIIKQKLPNISFDTVNRALVVFAQKGVIRITEGYSGAKRYDPTTELHHHFHCVKCNLILDFRNKDYDRIELPYEITKIHQVIDQKVVLDGFCQNCRSR
jgi:Fur family transcriptional regulator, peroxide stress response regulator